jgi:nucleoside-diphosphate-sugar epimerase
VRALVVGAAGFIGSHLCERLLAESWEVLAVDNFSTGRRSNLACCANQPHFSLLERDATYPISVPGPLDWVFHLASPASPPKYLEMPIETLLINSSGTHHLLETARNKSAEFLFASTSEIYGDPMVHPQPESYWGNVNSIGPRSVYDEAKRFGEALVMAYHRKHGVSTRLIRIFNTYGPRMDPFDGRVVSNMICQTLRRQPITIYGDGSQTRSFQYIDDLIEGIYRLTSKNYHDPINLGNPDEYTILELARIVQEEIGIETQLVSMPLPVDDPRQRRPDIARAREILGWEPQVDVRHGLRRSIEYFRSELDLASRPVVRELRQAHSPGGTPR